MFRFNIWSLTEEMLYRNVVMARLLEHWLPKPRVAVGDGGERSQKYEG